MSAKRKYDLYNQPGLFDSLNEPEETLDVFLQQDKSENANSDKRLRFISFGSGSSGNCAYIGNNEAGFLIDAGVNEKTIVDELRRNCIDIKNILGIIITHDHSDHVSYAYKLLRSNRHLALYCTPKTLNGILRRHNISRRIKDYHHPIYKEIPFKIKGFEITPFEVSHDGTDNSGFLIEWDKHRFVVATDMGYIGERAEHYIRMATSLMIESDYDDYMLRTGRYPEYLKARIMANKGHLENTQVANFIMGIWNESLTHIFLCHLSEQNNKPELARNAIAKALMAAGASQIGDGTETIESRQAPVQLYVLPRFESSHLFYIR